ncbi:hypothetical protein [Promicromonospora aerolata]|uniref:PH (Pleckstrin Homology) domain-containing protein n=1 Tax=Promicromonospora aerolata TaxID=195749 RepID=A0ABW4V8Q7_9MICO
MTGDWNPNIERKLVPGVSAHALWVTVGWALYIGSGAAVIALAFWVLNEAFWALTPFLISVVAFAVNRGVDIFVPFREKKEAAEGYATFVRGFGPMELEHVDPRTGRLVSFAGERLSRAERRERIRLIRAQHHAPSDTSS